MIEFYIHKKNGEVANLQVLTRNLNEIPNGSYLIKIEKKKKRTNNQNAFYWSCVVQIVYDGLRAAGFDTVRNKEDAHEVMKSLFLKVHEEKSGIKIERTLSTTELTTVGFSEYLLNISIWAFDYLGCSIPEPNQQLTIDENY